MTNHGGASGTAEIEWEHQDVRQLESLDGIRVTEDGAEAVALAYVHVRDGWVVKRRCRRGEYADWLLDDDGQWAALEISGTKEGDPFARLVDKKAQIARCSLPVHSRLAIAVAFDRPLIAAGTV